MIILLSFHDFVGLKYSVKSCCNYGSFSLMHSLPQFVQNIYDTPYELPYFLFCNEMPIVENSYTKNSRGSFKMQLNATLDQEGYHVSFTYTVHTCSPITYICSSISDNTYIIMECIYSLYI